MKYAEGVPFFDNTRHALEFALNYESPAPPPVMNREMARVRDKNAERKAKKLRTKLQRSFEGLSQAETALMLLLERQAGLTGKSPSHRGPPKPRDLDGAHLAAYVLMQFERLDSKHRAVLVGLCRHPANPCSCRSLCCSGWRKNVDWEAAVDATCFMLQSQVGVVPEAKGKRGLSTSPAMRRRIVEDFYKDRSTTLGELCAIGKVSMMTAARHKELILTWLGQTSDEAWAQVSLIFDQAEVTGAFA